MPDSTGEHTVLTVTYVQFLGDWNRFSGVSAMLYHANKDSEVIAVRESPQGIFTTYWFMVPMGKEVWITYDGVPLANIPARCLRKAAGDDARCSG